MINRTTWHPDTCGCQLDTLHDSDQPDLIAAELKVACQEHAHLPLGIDSGLVILKENMIKNHTEKAIRESIPEVTWDDFHNTLDPTVQQTLAILQSTGHFIPPAYHPSCKFEYTHQYSNGERKLLVNADSLNLSKDNVYSIVDKVDKSVEFVAAQTSSADPITPIVPSAKLRLVN